jgi:uncharacterized membrane protein YebE (DUF533 family)
VHYPKTRGALEAVVLNATELLGQILRSGLWRSTAQRLRHALGEQGADEPARPPGASFGREPRRGDGPGGLAEPAPEFVGADRAGQGIGPLALGGVGAVGGTPVEPGSAGGAMALLGDLALTALGQQPAPGSGPPSAGAPLGPRPPQEALDRTAALIIAAMINAAKADGRVDQEELQRIVGKLREAGAEADALDFVMSELRKPMDLEGLIRKVPDREVAVQLYAASLLAIEVDTEAERRYLRRLAHGLGLDPSVVRCVHQRLGADHA